MGGGGRFEGDLAREEIVQQEDRVSVRVGRRGYRSSRWPSRLL